MNRKLRILMCADSPDTILSYGLLSRMLIDRLYNDFEIHYASLQRPMGKPINRDGKFTLYSTRCQGERNPTNLPSIIDQVKPALIWTNFDIQVHEKFQNAGYISKDLPWVSWIPWDNHDIGQVGRAKRAFKQVDAKIAISLFGFEFLRHHGVRMDGYIYNIVDTDIFNPIENSDKGFKEFKESLSWYNPEHKYIFFVGRPNWRKRMTHMMAIIRELQRRGRDDIRLILHSNIYDPAVNTDLPELIDSFGLEKNIIFTHFANYDIGITKKELCYLYNLADLYIAPHGGEGFGMPIAESMACGTPFVATNICTTPEFAGKDNERGFGAPYYYPKDRFGRIVPDKGVIRPYPKVKEFADLIEQALLDENRLKVMGKNGVKWVREWCSPAVVAQKWKEIWESFDTKLCLTDGYK